MVRKIFKTGHSCAVTLSPKAMKFLGVAEGDEVNVVMDEGCGRVIIKKEKRKDQLELALTIRPRLGTGKGLNGQRAN